jgi:hypothetical protein
VRGPEERVLGDGKIWVADRLAEALYAQGRLGEAQQMTEEARAAARADIDA